MNDDYDDFTLCSGQDSVDAFYESLPVPPGWRTSIVHLEDELEGGWYCCLVGPELLSIEHKQGKEFRPRNIDARGPVFDTVEAAVAYAEILYL